MKDNLHTGTEVRERLLSGIRKAAEAVGSTMGTAGANVLIEAMEHPGHLATNDGATALASIHFADPIEEMGRKILLEAVSRANKQSGDGSSTTTVLTHAIIEEGLKHLSEASPMDIKRSLEECIPLIESSLNEQKREITVDEVGKVASISAEDEEIGNRIQEIYQQIGKDGIIHWDISKTAEDSYTIGSGITVEGAGFYSPYMCDADESGNSTNRVRLPNAHILLTKQKITSAADFNDLFQSLFNKEIKDIFVFCDEVDPLVLPDLIKTRMVRGFRTVIVKMPVLWKDWWYEDLAKATGATVIDPSAGLSFKTMKMEHLGNVENILVTKDTTYIDGVKDLSAHIKDLEEENTDDSKLRASRLNTKTARYFVGAHSESALSYRRLKVEDAISAAWQALQGGIVAGGGVALGNVGASFDPSKSVGMKILNTALWAPLRRIASNAGITDLFTEPFSNKGYNTRTKEFVDMFDAGITDPMPIVFNAAKNAISVAAAVLTANTVITLPREEEQHTVPPVTL